MKNHSDSEAVSAESASWANSLNNPMSQFSSGGLRRGITVAIVGSGIGFLLALTGLTTYSVRTDDSKPKSTIGKTGEMKSPGDVSNIGEGKDEMTKASIDLQDLRRRIYVKAKAEPSWWF